MAPHPRLGIRQSVLVAPLRREVEVVIGRIHHVHPARVTGISVEDRATVIPVEHADAGALASRLVETVVVVGLAPGLLLWRIAHLVVVVETAALRGNPLELPAHALLEPRHLRDRRD